MRKKYVIIAMDLGNLAAGIVFRRIITAMKNYADFDIICSNIDEGIQDSFNYIPCPKYKRLPYRIEKKLQDYQGYRISETYWAEYTYLKVQPAVSRGGYNAILSFVYAANFAPLHLGRRLAKKAHLPWIIYSVDAIPTPLAWQPNEELRNKLYRHLNKYIPRADAFFSANPIMMQYEKDTFAQFQGYSGVLLTPCDDKATVNHVSERHSAITFLYAGCIYGPRSTNALLTGFEKFHKKQPQARLVFVGKLYDTDFTGFDYLLNSGAIERHPFTTDLSDFYNKADVLIDLNANIRNDVFLSSKICNYLSYNKPILTISQDGSPVRAMLNGVESVVHSHHDAEEIFTAMEKTAAMTGQPIDDRKELQHQFLPDEVARKFCHELEVLIED